MTRPEQQNGSIQHHKDSIQHTNGSSNGSIQHNNGSSNGSIQHSNGSIQLNNGARGREFRVAIAGGGPGGLFTAWYLAAKLGPACKITIFEASERLGGKIV